MICPLVLVTFLFFGKQHKTKILLVCDDNDDDVAAPAAIGTWLKEEAVEHAPAIFSDAGVRTWIFLLCKKAGVYPKFPKVRD